MKGKMKDSEVAWIGQIPENWEVAKLKYFTNFYSGGTPNVSNQFNYNSDGVPFVTIKDMSKNNLVNKTEKHVSQLGINEKNLKILDKGTILYSIYATVGEFAELNIVATINQAILALISIKNINKEFLKYNLFSMKDFVVSLSNGNTQFNLNSEIVKNFYLTLPSLLTQQKIVEILDKKCRQIDELVRIEENEIEKLKEYKTSLITKVVTKGLAPNVKMKDSGIPWIGQIPENWEVAKYKFFANFYNGNSIKDEDKKDFEVITDTPYISTKDIDKENSNIDYNNGLYIKGTDTDFKIAFKYSCLICIEGGSAGKKIGFLIKNVAFVNKLCCVKPKMINNKFSYYILISDYFNTSFNLLLSGLIGGVSVNQTKNIKIAIPPQEIQQKIVEILDKKCEKIDNLIKIKQEKIKKLKEYKKSLIYQYVTGKKEV